MAFEHHIHDDLVLYREEDDRHATLLTGSYAYEYTEITRDQARALGVALLAYAGSPDPGPGAPFPAKLVQGAKDAIYADQLKNAHRDQQDVEEDGHGGWRLISPEVG